METQTPKEKFDAEMKQMNNTISQSPEKEAGMTDEQIEDLDEEVEAVEEVMQAFDKSMGDTKVEVTKEQFNQKKQAQQQNEILNRLAQAGGIRAEKLSPENELKMQTLYKLERDGKIKDPVLKHMITKKVNLAKDKMALDARAKEMQMKLITEFGQLADATMKCVSAVNTFNESILEYIKENPTALEEDESNN